MELDSKEDSTIANERNVRTFAIWTPFPQPHNHKGFLQASLRVFQASQKTIVLIGAIRQSLLLDLYNGRFK